MLQIHEESRPYESFVLRDPASIEFGNGREGLPPLNPLAFFSKASCRVNPSTLVQRAILFANGAGAVPPPSAQLLRLLTSSCLRNEHCCNYLMNRSNPVVRAFCLQRGCTPRSPPAYLPFQAIMPSRRVAASTQRVVRTRSSSILFANGGGGWLCLPTLAFLIQGCVPRAQSVDGSLCNPNLSKTHTHTNIRQIFSRYMPACPGLQGSLAGSYQVPTGGAGPTLRRITGRRNEFFFPKR